MRPALHKVPQCVVGPGHDDGVVDCVLVRQSAAQRRRTAVLSHLWQAGLSLLAVDTGTTAPDAPTVPRFGNPAAAIRPLLLILILYLVFHAAITGPLLLHVSVPVVYSPALLAPAPPAARCTVTRGQTTRPRS